MPASLPTEGVELFMPVEPISANVLRVHVPDPVMAAVRLAAERDVQSVSAYARRAILKELRSSGLYPFTNEAPARG